MKLFFLFYWITFFIGYWGIRSYFNYHRQVVLRHQYAERHRERLQDLRRRQLRLFE